MRMLRLACLALLLAAVPATADVRVFVRPGGWSDVVRAPDGFRFVRATEVDVTTETVEGALVWRTPLPDAILYLRAAADASGTVQAVAQGHGSGLAYVITETGVRVLGQSFGQNATAIAWFPGSGFTYYVQTSPDSYAVYNASCNPCAVPMRHTSQGFRDVQPDGTVRLGDDYFTAAFNGWTFWQYAQREGVTVGQCEIPGICAAVEGRTFTLIRGEAYEPHVAVIGQSFAVASRHAGGAALAVVTPPYPPGETHPGAPPAPIPPPVVDPAPVPAPQTQPPNQKAAVEEIRQKYPTPLGDRHAAFLIEVAQRTGGKLFRKDGGDHTTLPNGINVSLDVLIIETATGPWWIDILGDAENTARADWSANPNAQEPDKFIDVRGLTVPGAPTPTPSPIPTPSPDPVLLARLGALEASVSDLRQRLADADARLSARIDVLASRPVDLSSLQRAIDEALSSLEVNGKTEKDKLGLQHVVRLPVTRRK